MPTTWLPRNRFTKRQHWLLTNGDVIEEPDLEESSTGLKVRPIGSTTSFFSRDVDDVIQAELAKVAESRKAKVWMPIDLDEEVWHQQVGMLPRVATFSLPKKRSEMAAVAWWNFAHPTLPLKAHVRITLKTPFADHVGKLSIVSRFIYSDTRLNPGFDPMYFADSGPGFHAPYMKLPTPEDIQFREWAKEGGIEALTTASGVDGALERAAVESFHAAVMQMEEIDQVEIPDLRKGGRRAAWLTLKLVETNVNGQFLADLGDYIDSNDGSLEVVQKAYEGLVDAFRAVGVVLPASLTGNQLHEALIQGDRNALTVSMGKAIADDLNADQHHGIAVNLATGTFVVQCTVDAKDKIAHDWDEAVFKAEITGQEDELLAYARAYARNRLEERTKKIVRKRTSKLNPNH